MKLTYEEIQEKISNLKTMDDMTAFMKDITAAAVEKWSYGPAPRQPDI